LFPLTKKIPKEMLLNPILDILSLLKNPESYFKNENVKKFTEVEEIKNKIIQLIDKIKKDSHDAAIGKMAIQVAHDIRSPLAALDVATANMTQLPENHRFIVRNAIQRINDIANNLLREHRSSRFDNVCHSSPLEKKPSLIMSMLDSLLSEKRVQYANLSISLHLNIAEGAHTIFANVNSIEFKRVISNIINNSIEATHQSGNVIVSLNKVNKNAVIKILDNGCGIPQDILAKLSSSNISFGKKEGTGLGLKHAFAMVNLWNGKMEIMSNVGKGTEVTLYLPIAPSPHWFIEMIHIHPKSKIIIFDDDASIHSVWSERFAIFKDKIELFHFSSCHKLREWVHRQSSIDDYLFLMDYELIGEIETGLNLIDELRLHQRALLVTSHYEEKNILDRCEKLKIRILPKLMSTFIPIQMYKETLIPYDAILIDDDPLVHTLWELSACVHDKKIGIYSHVPDFLMASQQIDKHTKIYIDSHLGSHIKGEILAKDIYEQGFETIYLVTGAHDSQFNNFPWICGVIGKTPPWENEITA
jgi:signal transduction histidine kinase